MVVVLGAVEAELRCGEHFVELTNGTDSVKARTGNLPGWVSALRRIRAFRPRTKFHW